MKARVTQHKAWACILITTALAATSYGHSGAAHNHGHGHGHKHSNTKEHSHPGKHAHHKTAHHGVSAPFRSDKALAGFVELKLHDDKGDLELWLTKDEEGTRPYDLPIGTVVKVTFPQLGKTVELKVRNMEKNEDEDGNPNIRKGKTNYFIFPGDTGADASFLLGKKFKSDAVVSFSIERGDYTTKSFELHPHSH
jgi:hypothetical protein